MSLWFHRMKSLEQDALRAQMVLSKSQEGRGKRGPLERLSEAPSPAPTPSPTPLEGLCFQEPVEGSAYCENFPQHSLLLPLDFGLQTSTSPGRLVRDLHLGPFPTPCGLSSTALGSPAASPPLRSLPFPSCCPFKPLSGKKFDYRAFAALPSSRPVYDIQVLGATWPICTLLPTLLCLSPTLLHSFLCVSCCFWYMGPAYPPWFQPSVL